MENSKDHKAASDPPLDCRVMRSDWQNVWTRPQECGWYEYDGWLIDDGTKLFWNGNQWGYWINEQPRRNWTQMAEVATDKWRGILAHNALAQGPGGSSPGPAGATG